jgi:N4-bis(aminopropyl)spermidine synthase
MTDSTLLDDIATAARLREGAAGVAAVLRSVYRAGSRRLQDVARDAGLPLPVTTAVRRELEKAGLLERKNGLSLTEEGRRFAESVMGLEVRVDVDCAVCAGRGIVIPEVLHGVVHELAAIIAAAPSVDVTLDQAPCTPETAILRALLMLRGGDVEGRRILVLGDDDSVSIAIGLVSRALAGRDVAREIVVIDADPRRVAFLAKAGVRAVVHDLREPLPAELRGAFDVAQTDPPYTLAGARLFLARAAEGFAVPGPCYFSFARWPAQKLIELQAVFAELGFVPRAIHPRFNRYAGASLLGNESDLFELVQARAASVETPRWTEALYTAAFKS